MSIGARIGTALAGVAWLLLGTIMISFSRSPGATDLCHPDALWTGTLFFVPPLIALAGLALTLRRPPRRTVGLGANVLLLVLWTFAALPLWVLLAISQGATCAGG